MPRRKLLDLIDAYADAHADEAAVTERFRNLIEAHENCFERDCWAGHITGSAWLVSPAGDELLLTHHKKLGMWLQLGGHSDGEPDTAEVALREAHEESGLQIDLLETGIFDLDVHEIPARGTDPEHHHFDVRFSMRARDLDFTVSDESHALAWVPIVDLERYTTETSILRMRDKWQRRASVAAAV